MPLYVGTAQKRRRVKLLTAGDTVYKLTNVLGGLVDLQAIVNDTTNLRNCTLDWEQTKGETVQLSSENTLESSYVISDNTDKTFEFHLDKGLNTQQTKKVEIYYTPTSVTSREKGTAFKQNDNDKTVPNLRFEFGTEYPEPTGKFNPNVDIKVGTGIAFDDISVPYFRGKALRLRLYGEVGVWTHNPTTLLKTVDAIDGKVLKFIFVENGSYAVEVDYQHKSFAGEITYRSEPIFAFSAGATKDLFRGIDEVIAGSTGAKLKLSMLHRTIFTRNFAQSSITPQAGTSSKFGYVDRKTHIKIDSTVSSITPLSGTFYKLISVIRLNPSQIGNT
jgi:hypothetical protein